MLRSAVASVGLHGNAKRLKRTLPAVKALTFDTGGTILDQHNGLCRAAARPVGRLARDHQRISRPLAQNDVLRSVNS